MSTKKQHYVPQFYLKNFSDESLQLYVLNKNQKKIYKSSVRDICSKNNLYEIKWQKKPTGQEAFILKNSIENSLCEMEGRYANVLQKVISICSNENNINALILNKYEKEELAEFIANLYVRNPDILKDFMEYYSDLKDSDEIKDIKECCNLLNITDFDSVFDYSVKKSIVFNDIEGVFPYFVKNSILEMHPYIWISKDISFITASFPIICSTNKENNKSMFSSLFIPLTPKIAIAYSKNKIKGKINKINFLPFKTANKINKCYAENQAASYLISLDNTQLEGYL